MSDFVFHGEELFARARNICQVSMQFRCVLFDGSTDLGDSNRRSQGNGFDNEYDLSFDLSLREALFSLQDQRELKKLREELAETPAPRSRKTY